MACRSCDLKRIYRLFEEKKRREAEEAEERARREAEDAGGRTHKKKTHISTEAAVEPVAETTGEAKAEDLTVKEPRSEDNSGLILKK